MARVQKKDKAVETKQTVKPEASGVTGIKEESEKGELFFKIVLIVMSVALLGLIIYFVVDAIIGDGTTTDEKRYNKAYCLSCNLSGPDILVVYSRLRSSSVSR